MTTTTPLVRVDTTVNTDVKYSKVFALAFVKIEGVTGVFTEDQLRAFVIPKLSDATLFGSAIVQLDGLATGHNYHSGKGDETFTGLLTKVFSNGIVNSDTTVGELSAGIDVYFVTMDGVNETAIARVMVEPSGWELVHRDVAGVGNGFSNLSLENRNLAQPDVFTQSYSRLLDMKNGVFDTGAYKGDGKYLFRWTPYPLSSDPRISPDIDERHFQWTQTSNPTTDDPVIGFANLTQIVSGSPSTALDTTRSNEFKFMGLMRSPIHTAQIAGTFKPPSDYHWFRLGTSEVSSTIPWSVDNPVYQNVNKTELYIWRGPKPF